MEVKSNIEENPAIEHHFLIYAESNIKMSIKLVSLRLRFTS